MRRLLRHFTPRNDRKFYLLQCHCEHDKGGRGNLQIQLRK